jgi:hypothetical protein
MLSATATRENSPRTHVDRPKSLPHMVAREEVRDTGELMEELIFKAKERRYSDDGCLRIDLTSYEFGLALQHVSLKTFCDRIQY